jgi:DNA invertase Pin-like site-specific DNA recombinase
LHILGCKNTLVGCNHLYISVISKSLFHLFLFINSCNIIVSLAQMERELIIERTKAGLSAARLLGHKGGRKRTMTDSKIEAAKKLLAGGISPKLVSKNLGVSLPTLYRWIPAGG